MTYVGAIAVFLFAIGFASLWLRDGVSVERASAQHAKYQEHERAGRRSRRGQT